MYGTAQEEFRTEFVVELDSFCSQNKEPYLIGGDFKIIRYATEKNKRGAGGGVPRHSVIFNLIIASQEFLELHMS